MKNMIHPVALKVQTFIKNQGYEAYFVGGCVRDYLIGKQSDDYDITTNCLPKTLFELAKEHNYHVVPTGLQHGTITFIVDEEKIEVTTYRKENNYINHRSPTSVDFTTNLKDDLKRRDFTMNALAYDGEKIIDFVDGRHDIENKIIRCIGNPETRFQEDALRILRALRFSFSLSFQIEAQTIVAIKKQASFLKHISKERIRDELCKMLLSDASDMLLRLRETNVLLEIIPEMSLAYDVTQETPYHIYDVFHHTNACLNASTQSDLTMKLAILFHDLEKKHYKTIDENGIAHFKGHAHASATLSKKILKDLKFDNHTIIEVSTLIYYHDYYVEDHPKQIRAFLYTLHGDFTLAKRILMLQKLDNLGKNLDIVNSKNKMIDQVLSHLDLYKEEAFHIKDLAISGNDLLALGFEPKQIGKTLQALRRYICNQQDKNTKEHLKKIAGGMKDEIIDCK